MAFTPTFEDHVRWIEELVHKYGVEIDYFAWEEVNYLLTEDQQAS